MNSEKLQEKCALFGIYSTDVDVARLTYYGLVALQHRGQESTGISVSNGNRIKTHKGL
jgi:amidophosphoribosyltransferase